LGSGSGTTAEVSEELDYSAAEAAAVVDLAVEAPAEVVVATGRGGGSGCGHYFYVGSLTLARGAVLLVAAPRRTARL